VRFREKQRQREAATRGRSEDIIPAYQALGLNAKPRLAPDV
jgi:hypothetical protein